MFFLLLNKVWQAQSAPNFVEIYIIDERRKTRDGRIYGKMVVSRK